MKVYLALYSYAVYNRLICIFAAGPFLRDWLERHQPPCSIYKQCNQKYIGMFCALKTLLQCFKNIKPGGCFAPQRFHWGAKQPPCFIFLEVV